MISVASGDFNAKLNSSIKLLRSCSLLQQENRYPKRLEHLASTCRHKPYHEIWWLLVTESCYGVLLVDYSFFLFGYDIANGENSNVTMSYYGCPYKIISLDEYIIENYGEEFLIYKSDPLIIEEHEQAILECPQVETPITFRYDYSPDLYDPGRHPASHLHIGFNNKIRIGCNRMLNPLSFTAFVIRQQYAKLWKSNAIVNHAGIFKTSIRNSTDLVPDEYFTDYDKLEMYLD